VFIAAMSGSAARFVANSESRFIDGYNYVAPLAIFFVLAPYLARTLRLKEEVKFGGYMLRWLAVRRLLSCFWGCIFTALVFQLPLLPHQHSSLWPSMISSLKSFCWMATHSSFFFAMYAAIIVSLMSLRWQALSRLLDKILAAVENSGKYFQLVIPIFMLAVGAYIYGLPDRIGSQLHLQEQGAGYSGIVNFLGMKIDSHLPKDCILFYLISALLVGIACFIWHFFLILLTRNKVKSFSIKSYFANYWIKVYPLLWATSSEALATPLNLYLTKTHYPQIKDEIRQFVVGMGSYLNINGTLICVFVMLGVVANVIGFRLSFMELLFCVPIVFLIGYGVPGIPGELVLFAGPIAMLLNLPQAILPAFLALYCGLQLGLPDSFRSGNNSTDNVLCALLLNDAYEKKFQP